MGYRIESIIRLQCDNCTNWANMTGNIDEDETWPVVEEHLLEKAFADGWEIEGDRMLCRNCTSQAKLKHDLAGQTIKSVVFGALEMEEHNWSARRVDLFMEDGMCLSFYNTIEDCDAVNFSVTV